MSRTQLPTRLPTIKAQRILIWGRDYGGVCDQVSEHERREQRGPDRGNCNKSVEPAVGPPVLRISNDPLAWPVGDHRVSLGPGTRNMRRYISMMRHKLT